MHLFYFGLLLSAAAIVHADHKLSSFEKVDTDANKQISFAEFERSQKALSPEPPAATIKALFDASDLNKDQQLSNDEYNTLVNNLRADAMTQSQEIFKALDTNADGQLTLKEAEKAATVHKLSLSSIIEGVFNLSDANKDGVLSLDEFKAFSGKAVNPTDTEQLGNTSPGTILALVDTNGDGKISLPELRVFASQFEDEDDAKIDALFQSIDANKDGLIAGDELAPLHARLAKMIRAPIPGGVIPNAASLT